MRHVIFAITIVAMAGLVMAPTAVAGDPLPEPQCMQVYREYDFGIVRYVSPNSCEAHVWVNGEQIF